MCKYQALSYFASAGTARAAGDGRWRGHSRVRSNSLVAWRTSSSESLSVLLYTKRTLGTVRVGGHGAFGVVTLASHSAGGGSGLNLGVAGE